jgi:retinol dehydrogenase 12
VLRQCAFLHTRHHRDDGIFSVTLNLGNLESELRDQRSASSHMFLRLIILHLANNGAYTRVFAGLSSDVALERNCGWIVP